MKYVKYYSLCRLTLKKIIIFKFNIKKPSNLNYYLVLSKLRIAMPLTVTLKIKLFKNRRTAKMASSVSQRGT